MRQIAAEAGDHLLLGDGPPRPDAQLLELCAEIAAAREMQKQAEGAWGGKPFPYPGEADRPAYDAHLRAVKVADRNYTYLLRAAGKLRATTGAGIYAKALAIRASKTGAAVLAISLAEDLIGNPALRAALWAAAPEPTPAPTENVVSLVPRLHKEQPPSPAAQPDACSKKEALLALMERVAALYAAKPRPGPGGAA
jgi:hypothetical protein